MSRFPIVTALAAFTLLGLGACGDIHSYELTWTIGCANPADTACTITSARQCSAFGVDAIAVHALSGGINDEGTARFPCFDHARGSASTIGPDLPIGQTTLEVSALGAGGHLLAGPISVDVIIASEGFAAVRADLPAAPQCADGVDNDVDGLVDVLDPDCLDEKGAREGPPQGVP